MSANELAKIAVDIWFKIYSKYGAGLFESVGFSRKDTKRNAKKKIES